MVYVRQFFLRAQLGFVGLSVFSLSRKIFLDSLHHTDVSARALQRLDQGMTSALKILMKYPFDLPSNRKEERKRVNPLRGVLAGFLDRLPNLKNFLERLPNLKNIDGLFGDCLALFGSAFLENRELESTPAQDGLFRLLREIRMYTWRFRDGSSTEILGIVDSSASVDLPKSSKVFVPEFREISSNIYKAVESEDPLGSPSQAFTTYEDCGFTSSGAVRSADKLVFLHSSQRTENYFFLGQDEYRPHSYGRVLVKREFNERHSVFREAIYIYCRDSMNLYHFLMEVIPTALQVRESFCQTVPIILRGPANPKFISELEKILDNPIFILSPEIIKGVMVRELHAMPAQVNTSDSFSPAYRNIISSFNRSAVENVRKWFLDFPHHQPSSYDKIFLERRSSHRGLANEPRIRELAENRGFITIDPASLSFADQIALFSRAKVLVGAGGGVMGNYLFASPGAKIGQLVAHQNLRLPAPALICQVSGATLYSATGKSEPVTRFRNPLNWQHSDFELAAKNFVTLLDQMD